MTGKLKAERRETTSHGDLRNMRRQGKVPGVVYGSGMNQPTPITVEGKDVQALLRTNPHAVLELELQGSGTENVMLTEVQRDVLSREVLHIDFHKINMNESITAPVRIEIEGKPAGEQQGGMMQLILHELEVECLPKNLPDVISINVGQLQVGDNLTVGDIRLPQGVRASLDPGTVVLAILAPQKGAEGEATDDAAPDTASPASTGETVDK